MIQPTAEKTSRVIKAEAAEWFAKLRAPDCSAETQQDFAQWCNAEPLHELAYEQCRALWSMMNGLSADADIQRELNLARQALQPVSFSAKIKLWLGTTLLGAKLLRAKLLEPKLLTPKFASFALVLMLGVGLAYNLISFSSEHYETHVGEQLVVQLADGSTVTLNTDTEIKVNFSAKKRRVDLMKGEAYFSVSKDRQRPFEVVTASGLVRAVGTEFNVAVFNHELLVDVAEGIVQLEAATKFNPNPQVLTEIKIGEAVKFHHGDNQATIEKANLARISAWKANKIYFNANTLAEAATEYNRYIKERIVVVDNELNEQRITGIFNLGDIDTFVFSLEQGLNVRVERKQGLILVMRK